MPRPPIPPAPYLVVGMARSGVAAALALRKTSAQASIIGCDAAHPDEAVSAGEALDRAAVQVHLGNDGVALLDEGEIATLVKSPGVPQDAPVVQRARQLGIVVIGELELAWRALPNKFCAVTGTNGKTTTVEMIGAIHRTAQRPAVVAGNVGRAACSLVDEIDGDATVICETSSFQLEDTDAFCPDVAVMLNLRPDHLDRHGSVDDYRAAKLDIFANQKADQLAVLNASDGAVRDLKLPGQARRVWFGHERDCDTLGCTVTEREGWILCDGKSVVGSHQLQVRGRHNIENVMAATAAAFNLGIEPEAIGQALRQFPGVSHRQEVVAEREGVVYVNDSKATNVAATRVALRAFGRGVHLILGGRSKGENFAELLPEIESSAVRCYLIGEAASELGAQLAAASTPIEICAELETAVRDAAAKARAGEVVLLSPACASFDQFSDFHERGERFRACVGQLGEDGQNQDR